MKPPTVDRDGRDALVELMGHRFFARQDAGLGEPRGDEEPILQFRDDLQLMTDLAWLPRRWLVELRWPEADQAEFTFSLEPHRLRRALRRAARYAEETRRTDPDLDDARREQFERARETLLADRRRPRTRWRKEMTTKTKSKADPKLQAKPKPGQRTKPKSRSGAAKSGRRGGHSKERKPAPRSGSKRLAPGALADLVLGYMREHADGLPLGPGPIAKGLDRSAGAVANSLERLADGEGPVRRARKKPRLYDLKGDEPSKPAAS